MARPAQQGHEVGDDGREEGDVLGVLAQEFLGEVDEVVNSSGELHGGDGADDGHDDPDDRPRNGLGGVGVHPRCGQYEHTCPAGETDSDASKS